jgi:hypothetical protein
MGFNSLATNAAAKEPQEQMPAAAYMQDQLIRNDVVLYGTTHKQPSILDLVVELLSDLAQMGVTHLALEISSDQQPLLDAILNGTSGPSDIELHQAIDCPEYRRLLSSVGQLPPDKRPILTAIDLPVDAYDRGISRDQWMAQRLSAIWSHHPNAKVMAVVGSLHVLRKLNWQDHLAHQHAALRSYLGELRPHLKMHTVVNVLGGSQEGGDFSRKFGPVPSPVAVEVDKRFAAWQLGLTRCIAIKPTQPHELTDGIIIH